VEGWIKVHADIYDSNFYKDLSSLQRDLLILSLLLANHNGQTQQWKGEDYLCQPGQFISSLKKLKDYCDSQATIQKVRTGLQRLKEYNFLRYESCRSGRLITIVNWYKYKQETNVSNAKDDTAKSLIIEELGELGKLKKDIKFPEGTTEYKAAMHLRSLILANNPRAIVPGETEQDIQPWAEDMERIHRLGPVGAKESDNKGYSWVEIKNIMEWCQEDDFWKTNILSAAKLRKQITQLENKMKSVSKTKGGKGNTQQQNKDEILRELLGG
jgi:hypothetical protein